MSHYSPEYNLTDHLGNVRVTFSNGSILSKAHYYPFGMLIGDISQNNTNPQNNYLYNGKELQNDFGLDWYDYGARFYDAQLGRWHVVDRFAEKYLTMSPYLYAGNNPIVNIDINGDSTIYYSVSGERLFVSNDQAENAVTILNSENTELFQQVANMLKLAGIDTDNIDIINPIARQLGDSYYTDGIFDVFNKSVADVAFVYNGIDYCKEYKTYWEKTSSNEYRMNKEQITIGDIKYAVNEPNTGVSTNHTHPNAGKPPVPEGWRNINFYDTPQRLDFKDYQVRNNSFHTVTSPTALYFINRKDQAHGGIIKVPYINGSFFQKFD